MFSGGTCASTPSSLPATSRSTSYSAIIADRTHAAFPDGQTCLRMLEEEKQQVSAGKNRRSTVVPLMFSSPTTLGIQNVESSHSSDTGPASVPVGPGRAIHRRMTAGAGSHSDYAWTGTGFPSSASDPSSESVTTSTLWPSSRSWSRSLNPLSNSTASR